MLAQFTNALARLAESLWRPVAETPWTDWRDFWAGRILDDRYVVCYFLPLLPLLLLLPRRHLRAGIVLSGLAFLAYVFGVFYAALWLGMCVGFYHLSERFAVEARRSDVIRWGPALAATLIVSGWYVGMMYVGALPLPAALSAWLYEHAQWAYPLGARPWRWEPFIAGRHPALERGQPPPLLFSIFWNPHNIGVAYLAVRMLHYFSELKRDTIPRARRGLLNFLAYLCYAPNLMQGPIERYDRFQEEIDACHAHRAWRNAPPALARIGWGLFKGLIATWYFMPLVERELFSQHYYKHPEQVESYAFLYFGVYIHIFWLYLEFSGYCDVSAGMARLLGYRQVENFNRPWLATSLRDLWRRWHISLSFLLRDYVYIPLGGSRRRHLLNLVVTFGLIGVWHALQFQLLVWGVLMGLMVAVNHYWSRWMKRLDETPAGRLAALRRAARRLHPLPTLCAWALTMHCFCHSLLVFFGGSGIWRVTWELIRRPAAALLGP